jgi:cystathionine gamma-synthase
VTKLLAGHSDVTLGYVSVADPTLRQPIVDAAVTWGLTPSPWDCWMAERGMHSFDLRFDRAQQTAGQIADHLAGLDGMDAVIYPGRADHPDAAKAQALLGQNPGNMVSFRIRGGRAQANAFIRAAGDIPFAPTLGDIGTTLSHPASSSHRGLTEAARADLGINEGFFRLSVGIEDPDLLLNELTAAVAAAQASVKASI